MNSEASCSLSLLTSDSRILKLEIPRSRLVLVLNFVPAVGLLGISFPN